MTFAAKPHFYHQSTFCFQVANKLPHMHNLTLLLLWHLVLQPINLQWQKLSSHKTEIDPFLFKSPWVLQTLMWPVWLGPVLLGPLDFSVEDCVPPLRCLQRYSKLNRNNFRAVKREHNLIQPPVWDGKFGVMIGLLIALLTTQSAPLPPLPLTERHTSQNNLSFVFSQSLRETWEISDCGKRKWGNLDENEN